jgi:undecaprenyl diphosphate synthase
MSEVPAHVGYILDGNRRWAKQYGLPTYEGHLAGYNALYDVIAASSDAGVKFISLYTFSTQNWSRAEEEVNGILKIIRRMFKGTLKRLIKDGYRVIVLGSREGIPDDLVTLIEDAEVSSKGGERSTVAICFNYGGQEEIVRAVRRLVEQGASAADVTMESFAGALDHPEVPPCDLIVRTSGEQRLSDFMLWRAAYSEFIFLDKYWPEMTKEDVTSILEEYTRRSRRFGG